MKHKMKKSTKQLITMVICIMVILGGASAIITIYITQQLKTAYEGKLGIKDSYIKENTRTVYRTKVDIPAGEAVSIDKLEAITVLDAQGQDGFMTEEDLNKTALIVLPVGTHVLKTMLNIDEAQNDQREVQFETIKISDNITDHNTVDVRIVFPNGEDYLILSKKTIRNLSDGLSCYFWLNEEEILMMSSAMVDAYLYQGAKLYTVKYIEPLIQEASIPNYVPSLSTINLIYQDPNIVQLASAYLSEALRSNLEERLNEIDAVEPSVYLQENSYTMEEGVVPVE